MIDILAPFIIGALIILIIVIIVAGTAVSYLLSDIYIKRRQIQLSGWKKFLFTIGLLVTAMLVVSFVAANMYMYYVYH
jgi:hypothetical protein